MPAVGCALLPAVGPLFYPLWVRSSTRCGSALPPRCGSALLASFHQDHLSVLFTQSGCLEPLLTFSGVRCCLRVRQSRPTSAVHTPSFAVWCLGLSRACAVLLLRSSWHSMNRSPWHSMALQRLFPTSCSPVHVLTHVFSSRTLLHVLRVAACGLVVPNTTRSPPLRALRVWRALSPGWS